MRWKMQDYFSYNPCVKSLTALSGLGNAISSAAETTLDYCNYLY